MQDNDQEDPRTAPGDKKEGAAVILATSNNKGGSGKTTTAAALLQAAAAAGKKALAVDLDPQGNLTAFIGAAPGSPGSYELLHGQDPHKLIQATKQGIDVLAASGDLATERPGGGQALRLQQGLDPIAAGYDLIVIDTPPQFGILVYNSLQAADKLLIPLEADTAGLQGLYRTVEAARQIQKTNPRLQIVGCILSRFDPRPKINRYMRDQIAAAGAAAGAPLIGEIAPGIAVKEAQALQLSLFEYAPNSKPAMNFAVLYKRVERGQNYEEEL